jgi:hypothetical protein
MRGMVAALVYVILATLFQKSSAKQGLLVIPGLGRPDRLNTVQDNLRVLEDFLAGGKDSAWDCIIYVYAQRDMSVESKAFWIGQKHRLEQLRSVCSLIETPGAKVTSNLHLVQPALIKHTYQYVFVLLDDCRLGQRSAPGSSASTPATRGGGELASFDLGHFIRVMQANALTVASPRVLNANKGGGQEYRKIMQVYIIHFMPSHDITQGRWPPTRTPPSFLLISLGRFNFQHFSSLTSRRPPGSGTSRN